MTHYFKGIKLGFLKVRKNNFLSGVVLDNNFKELLSKYISVDIIALSNYNESGIRNMFHVARNSNIDYLYVPSIHHLLLPIFLFRERFGLEVSLIFTLTTFHNMAYQYARLIPLMRKYDIVISHTRYAKKCFSRISNKVNVVVLPPPIDSEGIQRANLNMRVARNISFMGRIVKNKGLTELIQCMPVIIKKVKNLHLNIIGPLSSDGLCDYPKSKYVKRLEREIQKRRLKKQIHFLGAKFGADKYNILSRSDLFINLTTAREELCGRVNIEALSCGVPIIATRFRGNPEIVRDGKNGYLIDVLTDGNKKIYFNFAQMIGLISNTLNNRALCLRLKNNAWQDGRSYGYYRELCLCRLLFKRPRRIKNKWRNKWNHIKDKVGIDFRRLFNKNSLVFLYMDDDFCFSSYSQLYKRAFGDSPMREYKAVKRKISKNSRYDRLLNKVQADFEDYVTGE